MKLYICAMKIVIIGTGNVATILGRKLLEAGHDIIQVWGRTATAAVELGALLHAPAVENLQAITPMADMYLIAVSDDAIPSVAAGLPPLKNGIIAHTAGSVPMNILAQAGIPAGILYPLQSLRKSMERIPLIPLLVDGSTATAKTTLLLLAQSISTDVAFADDATRLKLHLAAVISSNFTNHLYALTYEYCQKEQLSFTLLQPLIQETATRLGDSDPALLQTGPAARGDEETITKHLGLLKNTPELLKLYGDFCKSIVLLKNKEL